MTVTQKQKHYGWTTNFSLRNGSNKLLYEWKLDQRHSTSLPGFDYKACILSLFYLFLKKKNCASHRCKIKRSWWQRIWFHRKLLWDDSIASNVTSVPDWNFYTFFSGSIVYVGVTICTFTYLCEQDLGYYDERLHFHISQFLIVTMRIFVCLTRLF